MRAVILILALGSLGAACHRATETRDEGERSASQEDAEAEAPAKEMAKVVLYPPGRDRVTVRVELARTPKERTRGLMGRRSLDDDAGMLFLFEEDEIQSFWMKNTFIPLDMIFIDSGLRVVGVVENAQPMTLRSRSVELPSRFVLEVNGGFARKHGIDQGTPVELVGVEVDL